MCFSSLPVPPKGVLLGRSSLMEYGRSWCQVFTPCRPSNSFTFPHHQDIRLLVAKPSRRVRAAFALAHISSIFSFGLWGFPSLLFESSIFFSFVFLGIFSERVFWFLRWPYWLKWLSHPVSLSVCGPPYWCERKSSPMSCLVCGLPYCQKWFSPSLSFIFYGPPYWGK